MLSLIAATLLVQSQPEVMTEKIPGSLVEFKMIRIPAGKVEIKGKTIEVKSLWVGETEVTWDAYDIYAFRLDMSQEDQAKGVELSSRPSKPYGAPDYGFGHRGYAAMSVTHNAAKMYCEWLSRKTGRKYRIPTEAEWTYAALANQKAPEKIDDFAWYWDNADDKSMPVGKKKPNAWGIFDTLGNVMEWADDLEGKPVACGGSYIDEAKDIGPFARQYMVPEKWSKRDPQNPKSKWWHSDAPFAGFRVICEP